MSMALRAFLLSVCSLFVTICCAAASIHPAAAPVPDRYIVTIASPEADVDAMARALAAQYDGKVLDVWKHAVRGFWVELSAANAARLAADKRVATMEQDAAVDLSAAGAGTNHATPTDPNWHLTRITNRNNDAAPAPYNVPYTGEGVRVYVVDSGVRTSHVEFDPSTTGSGENIRRIFDALPQRNVERDGLPADNSSPNAPCDGTSLVGKNAAHGTRVASLAVGNTVGVAPDAILESINAKVCAGTQVISSSALFIAALDWIAQNGQRPAVVSISMYFLTDVQCRPPMNECVVQPDLTVLDEAVYALIDQGYPVVAAANNWNADACNTIPPRLSRRAGLSPRARVISVGGTDHHDVRWASLAGVGFENGSNYGQCVDIFAPAVAVRHAAPHLAGGNEDRYAADNGTSFSAPIVAGIIARLMEEDPALWANRATTADKVWERLRANATELDPAASQLGAGSPNLLAYLGGVTFLSQPRHVTARENASVTLTATIFGANANFQWYYGVPGDVAHSETTGSSTNGTTTTLTVPTGLATSPARTYWVRATRGSHTGDSRGATVTVVSQAALADPSCPVPDITQQPTSGWGKVNESATIQASVDPKGKTYCYQWETIAGAPVTRATITTPGTLSVTITPQTAMTPQSPLPALYRLVLVPGACPAAGDPLTGPCKTVSDTFQVRACEPIGPFTLNRSDEADRVSYFITGTDTGIGRKIRWLRNGVPLRIELTDPVDREQLGGRDAATFHAATLYPPSPGTYTAEIGNACSSRISPPMVFAPEAGTNYSCTWNIRVRLNSTGQPGTFSDTIPASVPASVESIDLRALLDNTLVTDAILHAAPPGASFTWANGGQQIGAGPQISKTILDGVRQSADRTIVISATDRNQGCTRTISLVLDPPAECFALQAQGPTDDEPKSVTFVNTHIYSVTLNVSYVLRVFPDAPVAQYKWYRDGEVITSATGSTYPITIDRASTVVRAEVTVQGCTRSVTFTLKVPECPFDILAGRCQLTVAPIVRVLRGNSQIALRWSVIQNGTAIADPANAVVQWKDASNNLLHTGNGSSKDGMFAYIVGPNAVDHVLTMTATYGGCTLTRTVPIDVVRENDPYGSLTQTDCKMRAVRARAMVVSHYEFTAGEEVPLSVDQPVAGATYAWYRAYDGEEPQAIGSGTAVDVIMVAPAQYWYIEDVGGELYVSETLDTTSADGHGSTDTLIEPPYQSISGGNTATITATLKSSARVPGDVLTYEWRRGSLYDTSRPVIGTESTLILPDLPDHAVFWCLIKQQRPDGTVRDYRTSFASVAVTCGPVGGTLIAHPPYVAADYSSLIGAAVHGKLLTMYWYKIGADGVTTTPITSGQIGAVNFTPTEAVTRIGASATDVCGNSGTLTPVTIYRCVPTITQPPPATTLIQGGTSARLTAAAAPASPGQTIVTTWHDPSDQYDLNPLHTGTTFDTPVIPPGETRSYRVAFKASCGGGQTYTIHSGAAVVEACAKPSLDGYPQELYSTTPGSAVLINISASGNDLTYQWYEGVPGDTSKPWEWKTAAQATFHPQTTTTYWCRIKSRGLCVQDTPAIVVRVCSKPEITTPPAGARLFSNNSTTLTVAVNAGQNTEPVTHQWQQQNSSGAWVNVSGATLPSFTTPVVTSAQPSFTYRVVVKAGTCPAESAPATVSLCTYPQVVGASQPDLPVTYNGSAILMLPSMSPVESKAITWYKGASGDKSQPVRSASGTNLAHDTGPLTQTTQYWAEFTHQTCVSRTETYTVRVCKPEITTEPLNKLIPAGTPTTLSITTTPLGGQSYQWYIGDPGVTTTPVGTNSPSLTVSPAATTKYWVRVTTTCGSDDSVAATVTTCTPPGITNITASQSSVPSGTVVTLSVNANGANRTAQWYVGARGDTSNPVTNGTSESIQRTITQTTSYWCRVWSDGICSEDSPAVTVSVCTVPTTTDPVSKAIFSGDSTSLSVSASPQGVQYQWYTGAKGVTTNPVSNATSNSITVSPTVSTSYWVRVTNGGCKTDSNAATVSMCVLPKLVNASPATTEIAYGESATLRLPAMTPAVDKDVTWYRGNPGDTSNVMYSGLNQTVYTTPGLTQTTTYWARFTHNGCVSTTTAYTVSVCKPTIVTHPQGGMINGGSSLQLTVSATGTGLHYQWYQGAKGDTSVPVGGNSSIYTATPTADTSYWVRVTGCGIADSEAALVTLCVAPSVGTPVRSGAVHYDGTAYVSVSASGPSLSYQWFQGQSGDTSIPVGDGQPTLTLTSQKGSAYYWVRVTSQCLNGTQRTTDSAAVLNAVIPSISKQPASAAIPYNGQTLLSVSVNGSLLSYQWHKEVNGESTVIAGETGPTFWTPPVTAKVRYWVKVTSASTWSVNSSVAELNTCYGPTINSFTSAQFGDDDFSLTVAVPTAQRSLVKYRWYTGERGKPHLSTDLGYGDQIRTFYNAPVGTRVWVRVEFSNGTCYTDTAEKTLP